MSEREQVALTANKPVRGACLRATPPHMLCGEKAERVLRRDCDLLAAILDTAVTLVVVLDSDGRIARFNRVCEQVTGYTAQDVQGQPFCELMIPRDQRESVHRSLMSAPTLGNSSPWEVNWVTRRGDLRLIAWSTVTLLTEQGSVEYVLATGSDITDRRRAEEALLAEEARLNSLLEINQRAAELSERDIVQHTLDVALRLTQSRVGYLHFVSPDQETLQLYAWSSTASQPCGAECESYYPSLHADVWAESVRQRAPVICNEAAQSAGAGGCESGQDGLSRYVSVPIMDGERVVLLIGAGNKPTDYSEADVRQIQLIGDHLWRIVRIKRAEHLMRESESRYRTLVEMSPDAIFLADLDGRFLAANPQFLQLYGYSEISQIQRIGLTVISLVAPHDHHRALDDALSTRRLGMVRDAQYDTIRQDGSIFPAEVSLSLIQDAEGRPQSLIGVSRDITARRKLEEDLRQNVRKLKEEDGRRNDFLAMLAHELRNPLAPICSSVEVLRRPGAAPELAGKAREVIGRQVEHLIRLVDDLLDVSRITRGKIEIQRQRVALQDVVLSGIEISRTLIDGCHHQLTTSLPEKRLYVSGDAMRLAQVVSNLLNNAAKYTPERGSIEVSVARKGTFGIITVRDNGLGIPREMLPRVFDMFVQADRSLDRSRGGLGLGLTLVRQLVELHGGSVEALSDGAGKGSTFVVSLPLIRAEKGGKRRPSRASDARKVHAVHRVLVVDDHVDSAAMLAELLNMHGQDVRTADNGPRALETAAEFQPDLVLLDIGLPDMDGYEVARRLREQPANRLTRLVALSGFGHQEALERSREAGFQHHLVKPVHLPALLELLQIRN